MLGNFGRNKCTDSLYSLWLLLIIVLCICSCTSEYNIFDNDNTKLLNFTVAVPSWKNNDSTSCKTRAMPISGTSLDKSSSFNIIADAYDGKSSYTNIINKETVSFTNSMWQTTASHYWPGTANNTLNFYAYYPTTISSSITHTAGSAPSLSYTVPNDAVSQIDIMAATSNNVSGSTNSSTPLTFSHIFAAVQFSIGSAGMPNGTITGITLNNILYKGTYSLNGTWTLDQTSKNSFSQNVSASTNAGTAITSEVTTFMMMPQTLGSDANITVTYSNGGSITQTITGTWNAGKTYTYNISYPPRIFNYTGSTQSYSVPVTGTYKMECWGASASGQYNPGKGGYTMGYITLTKGTTIYVYVGQQAGIYNGGGSGETSGGGATDIRLIANDWNDFNSLKSRIMVAGGGGGGYYSLTTKDGVCPDAGGLKGTDAYCIYTEDGRTDYSGHGGTQTAGGKCGVNSTFDPYTPNADGHFGYGGIGSNGYMSSGGGGGYYGGGHGVHPGNGWTGGGGGSSFISGYPGCNAIDKSSTSDKITHTGSPNHYSGYVFTSSQMIAGNASMPSPAGGTETGHTGNGYARITFVSAN